jgi:hypothetical protein
VNFLENTSERVENENILHTWKLGEHLDLLNNSFVFHFFLVRVGEIEEEDIVLYAKLNMQRKTEEP